VSKPQGIEYRSQGIIFSESSEKTISSANKSTFLNPANQRKCSLDEINIQQISADQAQPRTTRLVKSAEKCSSNGNLLGKRSAPAFEGGTSMITPFCSETVPQPNKSENQEFI
jgi:hypothetical protein